MSDNDEIIRIDTRLAGAVKRYHTWQTIGTQTIAEHTWNLLRIYFCVIEVPEMNMIFHMMFHDIGEHSVGDIPYPVKRDNIALKELVEMLEHRAVMSQFEHWGALRLIGDKHTRIYTHLSQEDKKLLKQIELMEMAEFGMDQVCLGNNHGFIVADRCLHALYDSMPCARLVAYVKVRLGLFLKQVKSTLQSNEWDRDKWWQGKKWEGF